jgi:hypothetical protein
MVDVGGKAILFNTDSIKNQGSLTVFCLLLRAFGKMVEYSYSSFACCHSCSHPLYLKHPSYKAYKRTKAIFKILFNFFYLSPYGSVWQINLEPDP